ncbi:hypothetical protein Tco_0741335 [Tanacetum coccineum]
MPDDDSQNSGGGIRRPVQPARVYTYPDFMKCQPLNFKGTEGVVGLSQWLEKMESVFHISGCAVKNQVKFATCTLLGAALLVGMVKSRKRCAGLLSVSKKLALMCTKFLADETTKIDKYIGGLPDNIHGNVMQAENKRKFNNNNQDQQQLLKKQNVVQAYAVGSGEKKPYGGSKPLCPKCNYHHDGECAPKCTNCKKVNHLTKSDCPVLKNQGTKARGMVYTLGGGGTNQYLDNTEDDITA